MNIRFLTDLVLFQNGVIHFWNIFFKPNTSYPLLELRIITMKWIRSNEIRQFLSFRFLAAINSYQLRTPNFSKFFIEFFDVVEFLENSSNNWHVCTFTNMIIQRTWSWHFTIQRNWTPNLLSLSEPPLLLLIQPKYVPYSKVNLSTVK